MTASRDEAKVGFTQDAPAFRLDTPFYLYLNDGAIGRTSSSGDRDSYALRTDAGGLYNIQVLDNSNGVPTQFDVYDRSGSLAFSSTASAGKNSLRFTASDTIYFVEVRASGSGFYSIVALDVRNDERVGIYETVSTGVNYAANLEGASDSDHFSLNALVGHNYRVNFTTDITDLNLLVSTRSAFNYTHLPAAFTGGVVLFSSTDNVALDLAVFSLGFRSTGAYSFVITDTTEIVFRGGTTASDNLSGGVANEQFVVGTGDDTVNAGGGNDTIDGGSGQSYLRGDDGNDSILGGAGFDDAHGNMGNDTVATGAGEDYCVGGKDNDSLSGGADYDLVYGNLGNDTCNGDDGNDIVRGGQGNDVVNGGAGDDFVSGDKGDDTMAGGAGADSFHTFGDAGNDRVIDFNRSEGDRVQLDPGTQFTVVQVGADTQIDMVGGGRMVLVGIQMSTLDPGWIFGF